MVHACAGSMKNEKMTPMYEIKQTFRSGRFRPYIHLTYLVCPR